MGLKEGLRILEGIRTFEEMSNFSSSVHKWGTLKYKNAYY